MLIHRQNLYAPRSKRRTDRSEAQSRGTGQQSKNPPCRIVFTSFCLQPTALSIQFCQKLFSG
jgi:hypothetical protein